VDTLSLQQMFESRVFKIPNYQRGYSWENDQIKDLIEDLELITNKRHYTGTIVLKVTNDKIDAFGETYAKNEIVDGQQRITSLVILLNEIKKELEAIKTAESIAIAKTICEKYIKRVGSQGSTYKLELDGDNNTYFRDKIIEGSFSEPKTKSHTLLSRAQVQFNEYLIAKKKDHSTNYFNYLQDLMKKITQYLGFTLYEVKDDSEVGIIFEVLNDRGKPLSKLDIVKNFLIYEAEKISSSEISRNQLIDKINYGWKEILENLSKANLTDTEDENQFLRINFILNFYSELKSDLKQNGRRISINSQLADIQKLVKSHFKELEKVDRNKCYHELDQYVASLKRMSYRLRDLTIPLQEPAFEDVFPGQKDEVKSVAAQFTRLEIQSNVLPVLVAIYERNFDNTSTDRLLKLMKLCEKAVFRIYYIADRPSYTGQSQFYALANKIYNNKLSYEEAVKKIREITEEYCPTAKIADKLLDKEDFYQWDGLRYFLYELERKRCIESSPDKKPYYPWDALEKAKKEDTIEHILPQTIVQKDGKKIVYWTSRFAENNTDHKKLGNMTLSYSNSKGGNKPFDDKKSIYQKSLWQITRDLVSFNEWNKSSIETREKELVDFAKNRWG